MKHRVSEGQAASSIVPLIIQCFSATPACRDDGEPMAHASIHAASSAVAIRASKLRPGILTSSLQGARLLLREINPDRDRNDNYSGYNQSTEDIFHFAPPLTTRCTTLTPIPSLRPTRRTPLPYRNRTPPDVERKRCGPRSTSDAIDLENGPAIGAISPWVYVRLWQIVLQNYFYDQIEQH